ncbi:MAG: amidohydrolase family protein [Bacteriovoracia bacterium]
MATRKLVFYRAAIVNPLNDKSYEYWPDGVLVTAQTAKGAHIVEILPYRDACDKYVEDFARSNLFEFKGGVILPAFFDMHFHWVQDDVRMMPKDSLLEWLNKYTFPTEAKFASKSYAKARAKKFFERLARVGTLGGACYSSVHEHALDYAFQFARGDLLIGNVLMTMESPAALAQTPKDAQKLSLKLMKRYRHRYVLTPRFAIATDPETMTVTSKEANQRKIFKQTHLSETPAEIKFVMELYKQFPAFKKVKSYTEIYHKVGMLGEKSLMGHAIHLKPAELELLKKTKTALVHCPTSNAPIREQGLGSGLFDFAKVERRGIRWALGSDIGGGPYLSMLDVMRSFVRQHRRKQRSQATYLKALYRATLAGAEILGVAGRTGNLAPMKEVNFVVVQGPQKAPATAELLLQKTIEQTKKRADYDRQVVATYHHGQKL